MDRFQEMLEEASGLFPDDPYLLRIDEYFKTAPQNTNRQRAAYSRAFESLDATSWGVLKAKALRHFPQIESDDRRGKQAFYNQLNEAFAYEFLSKNGFANIQFVSEGKSKSPDIQYEIDGALRYCEVKTISRSKADYDRFESLGWDGSIYERIDDALFAQIRNVIDAVHTQINALGEVGIVFIQINFDDFTYSHRATYRQQLEEFLQDCPNVVFKIGIEGDEIVVLD